MKKLLLVTIFITGLQIQQTAKANILESVQEVAQKAAFAVFESAINAGLGYAVAWLTLLVHEMGHAIAYSTLYGKFGHITMGLNSNDDKKNVKSLISLPGISIYNFDFRGSFDDPGYITHKINDYSSLKDWIKSINLKKSIFAAAGPLSQMGMSLAFLRWFSMHPFIQVGFLYGFLTGIANLIPWGYEAGVGYKTGGTDGFLILGLPKLSQSTLQNLRSIFSFMLSLLNIIPVPFIIIHLIKNIFSIYTFAVAIGSETFLNWVINTYPNDINEKDFLGNTALFSAVWGDKKNMVELLLQHGADSNIKDNSGWTAADYAWRKPEILQLIESYKKIGNPSNQGSTVN